MEASRNRIKRETPHHSLAGFQANKKAGENPAFLFLSNLIAYVASCNSFESLD